MRVRMCRQPSEVVDGILLEFEPGKIYDVGRRVARRFVDVGWAEYVPHDCSSEIVRPPPPDDGAALILVVDDDIDMRQLTTTLLAASGYDVVEAREGQEGLSRFRNHIPDLVLLDLNMPVMDGWQFCAGLQKLGNGYLSSTPVVLLTGADNAHRHVATLKAAGLVSKPFEPDCLLSAVGSVLNSDGWHSSHNRT